MVAWLALVSLLVAPASGATDSIASFTVYSPPIYLRRGEVHNAYLQPTPLPAELQRLFANRTVHFRSLQLDIVHLSGGRETPLPLYETYNHHHVLTLGKMADLQRLHNLTNGTDPFAGHNHSHGHPHAQAHGRGCSVRGEHLEHLLDLAEQQDGYGRVAAFGGASGAEFRGTSSALPLPFVYSASNVEGFMPLLHFINTNGVPHSHKLWECPCTSARRINATAGTVDGLPVVPFQCSKELLAQHNPACSLRTYKGGYRCCEHGVFLVEDPDLSGTPDEIQAKFTFEYYQEQDGSVPPLRSASHVSCCDVTGSSRATSAKAARSPNLEYDVPRCAAPPCEHVLSSVSVFDDEHRNSSHPYDPDEEMELVHAWGHQHIAGLGLELRRESTSELLCATRPRYGNGTAAGNENGFVVGIPPCVWGPPPLAPPPRVRRGELMRTVSRYDASENHTGVMGIWILTAAPAESSTTTRAQRERVFV